MCLLQSPKLLAQRLHVMLNALQQSADRTLLLASAGCGATRGMKPPTAPTSMPQYHKLPTHTPPPPQPPATHHPSHTFSFTYTFDAPPSADRTLLLARADCGAARGMKPAAAPPKCPWLQPTTLALTNTRTPSDPSLPAHTPR